MPCVTLDLLKPMQLEPSKMIDHAVRKIEFHCLCSNKLCLICFIHDELMKMDVIFVLVRACWSWLYAQFAFLEILWNRVLWRWWCLLLFWTLACPENPLELCLLCLVYGCFGCCMNIVIALLIAMQFDFCFDDELGWWTWMAVVKP